MLVLFTTAQMTLVSIILFIMRVKELHRQLQQPLTFGLATPYLLPMDSHDVQTQLTFSSSTSKHSLYCSIQIPSVLCKINKPWPLINLHEGTSIVGIPTGNSAFWLQVNAVHTHTQPHKVHVTNSSKWSLQAKGCHTCVVCACTCKCCCLLTSI